MIESTTGRDPLQQVNIISEGDMNPDEAKYSFHSLQEGREISIESGLKYQPPGLQSVALKAGIKYPDIYDLTVVKLPQRGLAAGLFTKNRSASPAVQIDRENLKDGKAQALIVISKNANVFTPTAFEDTREVLNEVAKQLDITPSDVMISCTGVIGVPLPVSKVTGALHNLSQLLTPGLKDEVAKAILTTDRGPKTCSVKFGDAVIAGMAKGAGMIEPNMATMLVYFFTNLNLPSDRLKEILARVVDRTFNSISVDTDTSTSDSLILFSTGEIAPTEALEKDFESALAALSAKLSRDIVYQAEGATKLIQATVRGAISEENARQVAKFVVNSPLVKTAIFGADPNWGRIVMAIGKPGQEQSQVIDPQNIRISINGYTLFERSKATALPLNEVSESIRTQKRTDIEVDLGEGSGTWTAWGCDLGYEYVKTNAEYTT